MRKCTPTITITGAVVALALAGTSVAVALAPQPTAVAASHAPAKPRPTQAIAPSATGEPVAQPTTEPAPVPVEPVVDVPVTPEPAPAPVPDPWSTMSSEARLQAAIDVVRPLGVPVDRVQYLIAELCLDGEADTRDVGGCFVAQTVEETNQLDNRVVVHPWAIDGSWDLAHVARLLAHETRHYAQFADFRWDAAPTRQLEVDAYDYASSIGVSLGLPPMPASAVGEDVLNGRG